MSKAKNFIGKISEMSRGKIKICVDENLLAVKEELIKLGYKVVEFDPGIPDEKINDWLNRNNVKIFFTKNYRHFKKFKGHRDYITYGVPEDVDKDAKDCAKVFEYVMMHHYHTTGGSGYLFLLNSHFLNRLKDIQERHISITSKGLEEILCVDKE